MPEGLHTVYRLAPTEVAALMSVVQGFRFDADSVTALVGLTPKG